MFILFRFLSVLGASTKGLCRHLRLLARLRFLLLLPRRLSPSNGLLVPNLLFLPFLPRRILPPL